MEDLEQESEQKRVARLKELEELVRKLKSENKQLLNKVNSPTQENAADLQMKQNGSSKLKASGQKMSRGGPLPTDDLDADLVDLEEDEGAKPPADEWLFVSPKLPPTPAHKKMSPVQWLSEGHNRNRDVDVPSLSDVRKTLMFSIDEAENLINSSRVVPGAESPPTSPSLNAKSNPSNRTAQKYLQQVRERRNSPPTLQTSYSPSGGASPTLGVRPASNRTRPVAQVQSGAVPVVKWTPKAPSESPPPLSDEEREEEIPKGRWNVRQVPSNNRPVGSGDNLKVTKWNPSMAVEYSSDEDEETRQESGGGRGKNDVPVVKWNAKLPKDSSRNAKVPVQVESGGGDVPVVKWKAKVPNDGDVPVVKNWRAKVPAESKSRNEDVPVVKWQAKVPAENKSRNEDVPVVKWQAKVPVEPDEDVPVVRWPAAKVPAEPEPQEEDVPVVKWPSRSPNSGSPNQRRGIGGPRGRGRGLAPPSRRTASAHDESENSEEGFLNGDSDHSGSDASMDNLRVSRYSAHQSGLQRRVHGTSTSRSPQTRHSPQTSGGRSGSPSPPEGSSPRLQNSHISRSGLAAPRQGGASLRNLSPSSQSSNSSQASATRSPSSSPGRGLKLPRNQLQTSASAPNQRSPPSGSSSSGGGGGKPRSGLSNSRGLQTSRVQQAGSSTNQQRTLKGSPSAPSAVRTTLTPPTNGQGKSRQLPPTPRQAGNGSRQQASAQQRVKQVATVNQGQSPKRVNQQRARPIPEQAAAPSPGDDDDSWLEGCF